VPVIHWVKSRYKKNGRRFSLNSKYSLKLKRLQVNQSWSSLRQTAKISLFSAFLKTEKNFLLNRKDFFSATTAKSPEKNDSDFRFQQFLKKTVIFSAFSPANFALTN